MVVIHFLSTDISFKQLRALEKSEALFNEVDNMRKEEITRKRNLELSKELDEIRFQLAMQKDLNSESMKKAKELITELEAIKLTWLKSLKEVENQREQYRDLINEVKDLRNNLKGRNAITRWFYKMKRK